MGQRVSFISNYRLTKVQALSGPVWLFLPGGAGLGSEYYESLIDVVQLPGTIYLLDFPGDGSNPKPLAPEHWGQGLLDVVKAFDDVHLVAHSFGAMFVMTLPDLEENLKALILISGSPEKLTHHHGGPSHLKREFPDQLAKYVTSEKVDLARELFKDLPYNDKAFMWVRDHFHPNFHPQFIPGKIPALLLTGEFDEITPFNNYKGTLFLERSNILTHVISGASHFPWLERPEEVDRWLNLMSEVVVVTDRLLLRRLQKSDIEEVAELLADPQVMRFSLSGPLTKEGAEEYLEEKILGHYSKWGFGPWGVFLKNEGTFIGMAGLVPQKIDQQQHIEIAYRILPRYWNLGYATEAAEAVRDWGFAKLHLSHIDAIIEPGNPASARVADKIGLSKYKETLFHDLNVDVYRVKPTHISDYQDKWPASYQQEERLLKEAFGEFPIQFFPIGSTSIPGCAAKPVLDIMGVVPDIFAVDAMADAVTILGYDSLGEFGMPHRRYFIKYPMHGMPVHLHIFEDTDPNVGRHLRFRDYLSGHPKEMEEYCQLKKEQALAHPFSSDLYTIGKSAFIQRIDRLADRGSFGTSWKLSGRRREWTRDMLLKAFFVNWHTYHQYLAKNDSRLQRKHDPEISIIEEESHATLWGSRISQEEQKDKIHSLVKHFSPLDWWVSELDEPEDLINLLIKEGLQEVETRVVMVKECELNPAQEPVQEKYQARGLFDEETPFLTVISKKNGKNTSEANLLLHANIAGIYDARPEAPDKNGLIAYCEAKAGFFGFQTAFIIVKSVETERFSGLGYKPLTEIRRFHG